MRFQFRQCINKAAFSAPRFVDLLFSDLAGKTVAHWLPSAFATDLQSDVHDAKIVPGKPASSRAVPNVRPNLSRSTYLVSLNGAPSN